MAVCEVDMYHILDQIIKRELYLIHSVEVPHKELAEWPTMEVKIQLLFPQVLLLKLMKGEMTFEELEALGQKVNDSVDTLSKIGKKGTNE